MKRVYFVVLLTFLLVSSGVAEEGWIMPVPVRMVLEYEEADGICLEDLAEIKEHLRTLVPDVSCKFDPKRRRIVFEGPPGAVEQVRDLFAEGSRDIDQVMTKMEAIDITPNGLKSLGLGPDFPKSMAVTVKATRVERMNGVETSRTSQFTRIFIGALNTSAE